MVKNSHVPTSTSYFGWKSSLRAFARPTSASNVSYSGWQHRPTVRPRGRPKNKGRLRRSLVLIPFSGPTRAEASRPTTDRVTVRLGSI